LFSVMPLKEHFSCQEEVDLQQPKLRQLGHADPANCDL
jgi:hypothetical protein